MASGQAELGLADFDYVNTAFDMHGFLF